MNSNNNNNLTPRETLLLNITIGVVIACIAIISINLFNHHRFTKNKTAYTITCDNQFIELTGSSSNLVLNEAFLTVMTDDSCQVNNSEFFKSNYSK